MQTKLTLRLEEDLIERAKNYAKQSGKSVSQLVADYFIQIQLTPSPHNQSHKTTRLCGALSSVSIKDDKQAYREHLDQKHL
jgi:hypothetical protein